MLTMRSGCSALTIRRCKHPFKVWYDCSYWIDFLRCIDCGAKFTRKGMRSPELVH